MAQCYTESHQTALGLLQKSLDVLIRLRDGHHYSIRGKEAGAGPQIWKPTSQASSHHEDPQNHRLTCIGVRFSAAVLILMSSTRQEVRGQEVIVKLLVVRGLKQAFHWKKTACFPASRSIRALSLSVITIALQRSSEIKTILLGNQGSMGNSACLSIHIKLTRNLSHGAVCATPSPKHVSVVGDTGCQRNQMAHDGDLLMRCRPATPSSLQNTN